MSRLKAQVERIRTGQIRNACDTYGGMWGKKDMGRWGMATCSNEMWGQ